MGVGWGLVSYFSFCLSFFCFSPFSPLLCCCSCPVSKVCFHLVMSHPWPLSTPDARSTSWPTASGTSWESAPSSTRTSASTSSCCTSSSPSRTPLAATSCTPTTQTTIPTCWETASLPSTEPHSALRTTTTTKTPPSTAPPSTEAGGGSEAAAAARATRRGRCGRPLLMAWRGAAWMTRPSGRKTWATWLWGRSACTSSSSSLLLLLLLLTRGQTLTCALRQRVPRHSLAWQGSDA